MKAGLIGLTTMVLLVLVVLGIFTVTGRDSREAELQESLTNAIKQTMDVVFVDGTYAMDNREKLVSDFTGNLVAQFASRSNVELRILNVDDQSGCLDVEATETFRHFTGKEGKVTVRKTVILEEYQDPNDRFYEVVFQNPDGSVYESVRVYRGGRITAPAETPPGFVRWRLMGGEDWDGDFTTLSVTRNLIFQAVCS